jgi:hypothetical protein
MSTKQLQSIGLKMATNKEPVISSSGSEGEVEEVSISKRKRKRAPRYSNGFLDDEVFAASMKHSKLCMHGLASCCLIYSCETEKVEVKCNQTGKVLKASVKALSLENGQAISESDLKKGAELLLDYNKKSFPVTILQVEEGEHLWVWVGGRGMT